MAYKKDRFSISNYPVCCSKYKDVVFINLSGLHQGATSRSRGEGWVDAGTKLEGDVDRLLSATQQRVLL